MMKINITNDKNTEHKFLMYLISAFDIIMLNACFVVLYYGICIQTDIIFVSLVFNSLTIIGLREWLTHSLQIPWLYSPFNRTIKRGADIFISILFILTGLPIIYIAKAIYTKKRKHSGSVVKVCNVSLENGKNFNVIAFNDNAVYEKLCLNLAPIAFNIIYGQLSIWDLKSIKEITFQPEEDTSLLFDPTTESAEIRSETGIQAQDDSIQEIDSEHTKTYEEIDQTYLDNDNKDEHI